MYDKAIEAMQMAEKTYPPFRWALGLFYLQAGRSDEGLGILAELTERPSSPWKAIHMAQFCAVLGDFDGASRWLEFEPHHGWVAWTRVVDWAKPLRQDPRFQDLLRRMNLPPL